MVTESPVKMPSTVGRGTYEDLEVDIDALLREHQQQQPRGSSSSVDRLRDLSVHRSGSAPPTVEGSMSALRSMLGGIEDPEALLAEEEEEEEEEEEAVRSHPAYLAYYYSNENTNPRLPPPVVSREDWRATQRLRSSFGGIGDQRKKGMVVNGGGGSRSLFSLQPGGASSRENEEEAAFWPNNNNNNSNNNAARRDSVDWGNDGLTGFSGIGLGPRKKSFVDVLQEDLSRSNASSGHTSVTVSRSALDGALEVGMLDSKLIKPQISLESAGINSGLSSPSLNRVHSVGSSVSPSLSSGRGVPPLRSRTPDPKLIQRIPSPGLPAYSARSNLPSDIASHLINDSDIAAALSCIDLSNGRYASGEDHMDAPLCKEFAKPKDFLLNLPDDQSHYAQQNIRKPEIETLNIPSIPIEAYNDLLKKNGFLDQSSSKISSNGHAKFQGNSSSGGIGNKMPPLGSGAIEGSSRPYNKAELANHNFAGNNLLGFSTNQMPQERLSNRLAAGSNLGSGLEGQYLNRSGNQAGSALQSPLYAPYLQRAGLAAQAASMLNDSSPARNFSEASLLDMTGYQKAYLEALLAQQKLQYGMPFLGNPVGLDHSPYANSTYGLGLPYSTSHVSSTILSSLGNGSPLRQGERLPRFPSMGRTPAGGSLGSWTSENGIKESGFSSSFLEEFKSNKTKSFELSDIVGHVVEFSADQYGSRFIQQKLETASIEEKNMIFPEILPNARPLMTDVFGNYVIQKFFEHGTETQRMQLASQLKGHVLPLSLQMYGCRVIQKALEVVDADQQTQMVSELDGSVMKCVRDQNGNHVIQKCIECVPQEKIQFIISTFYGQVVTLSAHPYGCRVIQRVLEHCDDAKTLSIMMEEILKSVSTLAQDQYGNYVVQHVLQHGKPEERSAIISTLAGQIVKMSQQKFASNVVEKCLTYGTAEERQLLINEMLGSTDENEPLQAMMKDQFGNYVVQKVLETCDDQNRELILSRIKVHLNALKRYTYGKHIVARVEKLVAAGERRVGALSSCSR